MSRKIERALISVSDKTGVVAFARGLHEQGVDLLSTGGTAKAIRDAGIPVRDISEFTGFPEMLDGRVKTLHPKVHAGLLHLRENEAHQRTMAEHELQSIDLVCVNLYPFEATVAKDDVTFEDAIENIDIGGPTMLRSAAKNMKYVTVVTDPADYDPILAEICDNGGDTLEATRLRLGQKVFARVASYNAAIADWLSRNVPNADGPAPFVLTFNDCLPLRYGENPHQPALLYRDAPGQEATVAHAEQLHGKDMSYNNYLDGNAALEAARELVGKPGAAIIKHTNPCGFATGNTLREALEAGWAGDPVSAFGSVIAVTVPVDADAAEFLAPRFVEVIIAPDFTPEALERLTAKKNLRLLKLHAPFVAARDGRTLRQIGGGLLVQSRDNAVMASWEVKSKAEFPANMAKLAEFGVRACKHVKSNAILLVREHAPGRYQTLGMGAGQPNRVDSVKKLSIARAHENIRLMHEAGEGGGLDLDAYRAKIMGECILISDAFFPFADNIEAAAEAGIRYIVEPGGSVKDDEVVAACDAHNIAIAFTGMRHFLH
ncbi:MAG: bifunctional phosphoribosylaminoimidazolecarboxamide formyltransferase/IMP cyclohydrolase [Verrucomicrobia bacterium]|nr:bifunctional phosphoribosylaminoimidazolecarboxamide formyltransferase/IMP cyclohydrolase [Verrucomicrobiota bacterium]